MSIDEWKLGRLFLYIFGLRNNVQIWYNGCMLDRLSAWTRHTRSRSRTNGKQDGWRVCVELVDVARQEATTAVIRQPEAISEIV